MNKIYYDAVKQLEVCDLSGVKSLEQINAEFNGNFVDITKDRINAAIASKAIVEANNEIESLIQSKIREQAISALKVEGKLDVDGKIVKP